MTKEYDMHPKKTITILVAVSLLLFVYYSINASPIISDENYTYISGLTWYNTFEEGQKVALEQDKPMLVYFWAIWCKFCEKLHTEVYPDPEINKLLKEDFVLVAVDLDVNKKDAQAFGIQYPPAEVFVTPEGDIIDKIGGYMRKEYFLIALKQVKKTYHENREVQNEHG